jgi:imidazolonepropionase-like amidohydrolase
MHIVGEGDQFFDVTVRGGRFASVTAARPEGHGPELWMSPGFIDLHTHLAWTDFSLEDCEKRTALEKAEMLAQACTAAVRTGITTARDAGGLSAREAADMEKNQGCPLRVLPCGHMFRNGDGTGLAYGKERADGPVIGGWVKIFATGGLGAEPEDVLTPLFTKDTFFSIVRGIHGAHEKVMVHPWGGATLDWSVEAGVDSVEHGVYLTQRQAEGLAKAGIPFIPTISVYRIATEEKGALGLDATLRARAARAAQAHPQAVRNAIQGGVQVGFGTDYATPALYGRNLEELDALTDCGLTRREAFRAATETPARILGLEALPSRIRTGLLADAVFFNKDPYQASDAKALRASIDSVMAAGRPIRWGEN